MNADAMIWLAGCILFLTAICTIAITIWYYLVVEEINAEVREAIESRKRRGAMIVKPIKLYIA